jgi:hypothetical protein
MDRPIGCGEKVGRRRDFKTLRFRRRFPYNSGMRAITALILLFPARGAKTQEESPPPVAVTDKATQPSLAIDSEGGLYVVFFRNGNVELSISRDRGKTFSPPVIAIDARGKALPIPLHGPRVGVDSRKKIYISAALDLGSGSGINDLYYVSSTDGKTFSKPVLINEPKTASESAHALGVSPSGDLHVAWVDSHSGKPLALAYARITEGAKKPPKVLILASPLCEACPPAVAVDLKGNPVIVYREGAGKGNRQVYALSSTTGGGSFGKPIQVNERDGLVKTCPLDSPAVAISPDGKTIAVAWMDLRAGQDDRNVYWTFSQEGKFPRETDANDDRRYYQGRPAVAYDASGVAWCAWEDGRHGKLQVYASAATSEKAFAVTLEKEPRASAPALASGGGLLAVVYESGEGIALRILATR